MNSLGSDDGIMYVNMDSLSTIISR